MYLFFDTETTGLPLKYNAPVTDTANWPRMVQLAWLEDDGTSSSIRGSNCIIFPVGYRIPDAVAKIHGITQERALTEGLDLRVVLTSFAAAVRRATCLVAHNIDFDISIIGAEFMRLGMRDECQAFLSASRICTMKTTTDLCGLKATNGRPKWPKLRELHQHLFGEEFANAHDAAADIMATAKCFYELQARGVI